MWILDLFCRFFKGRCHGNQLYGKMWVFSIAAFENGLQYCHFDFKIFNDNILATSYTSLLKIGPVTPEIMRTTNAPF